MPRHSRPNPNIEKHRELLKKMNVGDSFFVAGRTPSQLDYVRRLGYAVGYRLSIRHVRNDPIYGKACCRIQRTR